MRNIIMLGSLFLILTAAAFGQTAAWKNQGAFVVRSDRAIPAFPRRLSGYKAIENSKDFFDRDFTDDGALRIFGWKGWTEISDFPYQMNHCGEEMFMIRWRTSNPNVRVTTNVRYGLDNVPGKQLDDNGKTGSYGYMYATTCEEPIFKFTTATQGDASNLTDIYYEIKFWRAAP